HRRSSPVSEGGKQRRDETAQAAACRLSQLRDAPAAGEGHQCCRQFGAFRVTQPRESSFPFVRVGPAAPESRKGIIRSGFRCCVGSAKGYSGESTCNLLPRLLQGGEESWPGRIPHGKRHSC